MKIGVDLTRISRFVAVNSRLVMRILHPLEMAEYENATDKSKFLAARWAIKEAMFKIDNNLIFNRIQIEKKEGVYTYPGYQISTSNEADLYIAFVVRVEDDFKN